MEVKLIAHTPDMVDIMWTAARTCYSEKSPIEIWKYDRYNQTQEEIDERFELSETWIEERQDKMWSLVKNVLSSGHCSIAEHCYFTFAVEGVSRACSHQMVRHRAGIVFSQKSQRYVKIKENYDDLLLMYHHAFELDDREVLDDVLKFLDKYFVGVREDNAECFLTCLMHYALAISKGKKAEDARAFLPNATKTDFTVSMNLRELMHICNLRLCTRSQFEIRSMVGKMAEEVIKVEPKFKDLLQPKCVIDGFCRERNSCGFINSKQQQDI